MNNVCQYCGQLMTTSGHVCNQQTVNTQWPQQIGLTNYYPNDRPTYVGDILLRLDRIEDLLRTALRNQK